MPEPIQDCRYHGLFFLDVLTSGSFLPQVEVQDKDVSLFQGELQHVLQLLTGELHGSGQQELLPRISPQTRGRGGSRSNSRDCCSACSTPMGVLPGCSGGGSIFVFAVAEVTFQKALHKHGKGLGLGNIFRCKDRQIVVPVKHAKVFFRLISKPLELTLIFKSSI